MVPLNSQTWSFYTFLKWDSIACKSCRSINQVDTKLFLTMCLQLLYWPILKRSSWDHCIVFPLKIYTRSKWHQSAPVKCVITVLDNGLRKYSEISIKIQLLSRKYHHQSGAICLEGNVLKLSCVNTNECMQFRCNLFEMESTHSWSAVRWMQIFVAYLKDTIPSFECQ